MLDKKVLNRKVLDKNVLDRKVLERRFWNSVYLLRGLMWDKFIRLLKKTFKKTKNGWRTLFRIDNYLLPVFSFLTVLFKSLINLFQPATGKLNSRIDTPTPSCPTPSCNLYFCFQQDEQLLARVTWTISLSFP